MRIWGTLQTAGQCRRVAARATLGGAQQAGPRALLEPPRPKLVKRVSRATMELAGSRRPRTRRCRPASSTRKRFTYGGPSLPDSGEELPVATGYTPLHLGYQGTMLLTNDAGDSALQTSAGDITQLPATLRGLTGAVIRTHPAGFWVLRHPSFTAKARIRLYRSTSRGCLRDPDRPFDARRSRSVWAMRPSSSARRRTRRHGRSLRRRDNDHVPKRAGRGPRRDLRGRGLLPPSEPITFYAPAPPGRSTRRSSRVSSALANGMESVTTRPRKRRGGQLW